MMGAGTIAGGIVLGFLGITVGIPVTIVLVAGTGKVIYDQVDTIKSASRSIKNAYNYQKKKNK